MRKTSEVILPKVIRKPIKGVTQRQIKGLRKSTSPARKHMSMASLPKLGRRSMSLISMGAANQRSTNESPNALQRHRGTNYALNIQFADGVHDPSEENKTVITESVEEYQINRLNRNSTQPVIKLPFLKVQKKIRNNLNRQFSSTAAVTKIRRIVLPRKRDNMDLPGEQGNRHMNATMDSEDCARVPSLSKSVQVYNERMEYATEQVK